MIKVSKIAHSPNGTQESFECSYEAKDLEGFSKDPILVKGHLLRVEEGLLLRIEELKAKQEAFCSRCGKKLNLSVPFSGSEWLFYTNKPLEYDDENELLFVDRQHWELDPSEAIRQELILNQIEVPRCAKECVKFPEAKEEAKTVRALSNLKEMI